MTETQTEARAEPQAPAKQSNGGGPKAPLVVAPKGVGAIVPADVDQAWRLATIIATADMAPKAYRKDPNAIMIGIMHGMEVGFTPMAALQSIAVINGMPTIWGDGALALVRASGLLEDFDELYEGEGDGLTAVCICKRRDQASPIRRTFSMDDANAAGLKGKQGPWSQYPRRMLQMRARSWALRDGFADVLRGLGVAEEARDMGELVVDGAGTYRPGDPPRPQRADYAQKAADRQEREQIDAERAAAGKPPIDQVDEEPEPEESERGNDLFDGADPTAAPEIKQADRDYAAGLIGDIQACETHNALDRLMDGARQTMESLPQPLLDEIEGARAIKVQGWV